MIVGNGMIAKTFSHYVNNDSVIIFASGVSNSSETSEEQYDREFNLLKSHIHDSKKLIYFSTISIFDPSLQETKYVQHKKEIENFIKINCNCFLIFRLPIVISNAENEHTFFNNLKIKIVNNESISVKKMAHRYIIGVDDLKKFLSPIINSEIKNKTINIAFNNRESVCGIVTKMAHILEKKPIINILDQDCQSNYIVDNEFFLDTIKENKNENYNFELLKKYLL